MSLDLSPLAVGFTTLRRRRLHRLHDAERKERLRRMTLGRLAARTTSSGQLCSLPAGTRTTLPAACALRRRRLHLCHSPPTSSATTAVVGPAKASRVSNTALSPVPTNTSGDRHLHSAHKQVTTMNDNSRRRSKTGLQTERPAMSRQSEAQTWQRNRRSYCPQAARGREEPRSGLRTQARLHRTGQQRQDGRGADGEKNGQLAIVGRVVPDAWADGQCAACIQQRVLYHGTIQHTSVHHRTVRRNASARARTPDEPQIRPHNGCSAPRCGGCRVRVLKCWPALLEAHARLLPKLHPLSAAVRVDRSPINTLTALSATMRVWCHRPETAVKLASLCL